MSTQRGEFWGIDLGGTKLEGVVLPENGGTQPICRIRIDTEADRGYEHILDRVAELVERMSRELGGARPARIGFGTPGIADPRSGQMKNCNTTCLNGRPLLHDLRARLGADVRIANDANCFALAESRFGAGRGAASVFGVIMGTGVGGGLVIDGKAVSGLQGLAGEWGHNVLDPSGAECYCGKRGCVETVISGPALERFYRERSGISKRLGEITRSAPEGDRDAVAVIDRLCDSFARAISVVINIVDPEVVVLGGGVSNVAALYERVEERLLPYVFNDRVETRIERNQLGDSGGVFGAALL